MTLYMPPLQRKKRVPNRYDPDSFRVISNDAENAHPKFASKPDYRPPTPERERTGLSLPDIYNRNTQVLPKTVPDYRAHRPHPGSCGFLRHNVRVLNEPICSVFTSATNEEQSQWWPSRTSNDPLLTPPQTRDTTYRGDFMKDSYGNLHRTTRHESHKNRDAALGPDDVARKLASYELRQVPVNFLKPKGGDQRILQEKISFEHDYNSRDEPNYPIRGKRVGNFVWSQMNPEMTKKFIDQHSNYTEAEKAFREAERRQREESNPIIGSPNRAPSSGKLQWSKPQSPPKEQLASPATTQPSQNNQSSQNYTTTTTEPSSATTNGGEPQNNSATVSASEAPSTVNEQKS